ncbi:DUF975 family protein [Paenibacillus ginsengarvi]|uniref:DUF975 family protein n=1 Tax=Paenibacillus ginsengarvi TaxID=400777 RepID=A0A3B0C8R9_9BACL|nr:DUF975 family protein [Paenibacillus ginsengarvi]RKN80619.1 DUF975 family protein [Paenibacillus ginsengarvi]
MPTSSELRATARKSLSGNWLPAIGITLLFAIIIGVLSYIPYIGGIAVLIVGGPLTLGLVTYYLKLVRGGKPGVELLFGSFDRFAPAFLVYLLVQIFVFLWSLLLIVPGIIAALRYSQSFYILQENPNIEPMEAIRQSKEMMVGHKGRLFVLYLTFIGWAILAAIPFGLGFIWLQPYIMTTQAAFYEDLKGRSGSAS